MEKDFIDWYSWLKKVYQGLRVAMTPWAVKCVENKVRNVKLVQTPFWARPFASCSWRTTATLGPWRLHQVFSTFRGKEKTDVQQQIVGQSGCIIFLILKTIWTQPLMCTQSFNEGPTRWPRPNHLNKSEESPSSLITQCGIIYMCIAWYRDGLSDFTTFSTW